MHRRRSKYARMPPNYSKSSPRYPSAFNATTRWGATLHASFCLAYCLAVAEYLRIGEFAWSRSERNAVFQQWHITKVFLLLQNDNLEFSLTRLKGRHFSRRSFFDCCCHCWQRLCPYFDSKSPRKISRTAKQPFIGLGSPNPFTRLVTQTLR